ncbi:RNA polymerase sigma factor [Ulvibacterium marinum]|uniref:RNA polymerase sigma factor n=1 Tax=Ulvibacterium marinum TaxID=2419782 RepID=A0A3B0CEG2_9FLAO|nr:RNA polymerase sigma factor [Ulvibacterium marinum]RKN83024.1 RNA polymerase sigma factor [Ulvibacterium marinum]
MDKDLEDMFLNALEEHQQKLLRICSVYASDSDDTQDLFQEVLINIWRAMPSFKGNASIGTWMYRITLNVCLRIRTKEIKKQKKMLRLDSIRVISLQNESWDNDVDEKLTTLRSCIKTLNDADKALITLYLEELPYKEISNITGLKENTVAVKIKRVKTKLLNRINGV